VVPSRKNFRRESLLPPRNCRRPRLPRRADTPSGSCLQGAELSARTERPSHRAAQRRRAWLTITKHSKSTRQTAQRGGPNKAPPIEPVKPGPPGRGRIHEGPRRNSLREAAAGCVPTQAQQKAAAAQGAAARLRPRPVVRMPRKKSVTGNWRQQTQQAGGMML